jgi:nucleoside-diphosphate-sugar epimerase
MRKLNVLVTGANGLLGRNLVASLRDNYEVHALVHNMPLKPFPDVKYYAYDFNMDWTTNDLPRDIYAVMHLAQSELFRDFPEHALDVFNVNVTSTVKLLDYARVAGAKKFVFTSTGGIYDTTMGVVNENTPINTFGQLGNYFATKLCSEILTHNYTSYFDVSLLRLFFMYGKGQKRSMLMPRLVDNVNQGRPIRLTENGGIVINPIHVSDVVNILKGLMNSDGSYTYNVAGPEKLNLNQIASIIGKKLGKTPQFEQISELADNCIADITLLESRIYSPKVKLEEKIEELFQ